MTKRKTISIRFHDISDVNIVQLRQDVTSLCSKYVADGARVSFKLDEVWENVDSQSITSPGSHISSADCDPKRMEILGVKL